MKSNKQLRNRFYRTMLYLLCTMGLLGCMKDPLAIPTIPPTIPPTVAVIETPPVLELLPTPPDVSQEEDPLRELSAIPDLYMISNGMEQRMLASYLKTTSAQLARFNPNLPSFVAPGEVIAVPSSFYMEEEMTAVEVAQETGLPLDQLLAANPDIQPDETLPVATTLAVPHLYIVAEPVPLVEVADLLAAEMTSLSAANPDLPQAALLSAGTVLVRPVERGSIRSATE